MIARYLTLATVPANGWAQCRCGTKITPYDAATHEVHTPAGAPRLAVCMADNAHCSVECASLTFWDVGTLYPALLSPEALAMLREEEATMQPW